MFSIFRQQGAEPPRRFGWLDVAGGAVKQPETKPFFKKLDLLAHRRAGNAKAAGGGRKAPAPNHFKECLNG